MSPKIAIVVLCGLPASGKTTLCSKLKQLSTKVWPEVHLIHVNFDRLLQKDDVKWDPIGFHFKQKRNRAHESVKKLLDVLIHAARTDTLDVKLELIEFEHVAGVPHTLDPTKPVVIMLDDNMYYNSMRYAYYQLAREANTGFGILYLKCDLNTVFKRNSNRISEAHFLPIPSDVIVRMYEKFEEPDASKREWERNVMIIDAENQPFEAYFGSIKVFVNLVLDDPVSTRHIEEQLTDQKLKAKSINNNSLIHTADLMVRRVINEHVTSASEDHSTDLSSLRSKLTKAKRILLNKIRRDEYGNVNLRDFNIIYQLLLHCAESLEQN